MKRRLASGIRDKETIYHPEMINRVYYVTKTGSVEITSTSCGGFPCNFLGFPPGRLTMSALTLLFLPVS